MNDIENLILNKLEKIEDEIVKIKVACASNCKTKITIGAKEWSIISGIIGAICTTITLVINAIIK